MFLKLKQVFETYFIFFLLMPVVLAIAFWSWPEGTAKLNKKNAESMKWELFSYSDVQLAIPKGYELSETVKAKSALKFEQQGLEQKEPSFPFYYSFLNIEPTKEQRINWAATLTTSSKGDKIPDIVAKYIQHIKPLEYEWKNPYLFHSNKSDGKTIASVTDFSAKVLLTSSLEWGEKEDMDVKTAKLIIGQAHIQIKDLRKAWERTAPQIPKCESSDVSKLLLKVMNDSPKGRSGVFTAKRIVKIEEAIGTEDFLKSIERMGNESTQEEKVLLAQEIEHIRNFKGRGCTAQVQTNTGYLNAEVTLSWEDESKKQIKLEVQFN